ncbi:TolB-like translocation protein, partial [Halocola ammonii]
MLSIRLSLVLLFLTLFSCQKDGELDTSQPSPPANCTEVSDTLECEEFPMLGITWFSDSRFQYEKPFFNPENNCEFVYGYKDYEKGEFKLMKFNLVTCEKEVIVDQVRLLNQPEWGRSGWIAFDNQFNYMLWRVNSNGNSLSPVFQETNNLYPVWSDSGDKLYWQHTPSLGVPYYFLQLDIIDQEIDTLINSSGDYVGSTSKSDISGDNKLITRTAIDGENQIGFSPLDNIEFVPLVNLVENDLASLTGLCWSNTGDKAYFTEALRGLYELEVPSGEHTQLIDFCDNFSYESISCSEDGTQLIAERVDRELITLENGNYSGEIRQTSSIVL